MASPERNAWATESAATLVLGLAALLVALDGLVVAPLLPLVAADYGISIGRAGILVTAYMIPYGLSQIAYGLLADRFGKLRVMRLAFLLFALATGLCGVAGSLAQFAWLRGLAGLAGGCVVPTGVAYFGEMVPYERRQAVLAVFLSFYSLGLGLSVALGGLAGLLSWRILFAAYGLGALAVAAAMFRLPLDGGRPVPLWEGLLAYLGLLRSGAYRLLVAFAAGEGVAFFAAFSFTGAYAAAVPGRPLWLVGLLLAPVGLVPVLGRGWVPSLRQRLGERRLAALGFGAGALGWLLLWLAPHNVALFALGVGLIGFCYLTGHTAVLAAASEVGAAARGRAMSLWSFTLFATGGLASEWLRRSIDSRGYSPLLLVGLGGLALMAVVARFTLPQPG